MCRHGHRWSSYLRRQPPHGFFLTSPHLWGPGTAASSQGAVSGLGLREREALSIWTQHNTLSNSFPHIMKPIKTNYMSISGDTIQQEEYLLQSRLRSFGASSRILSLSCCVGAQLGSTVHVYFFNTSFGIKLKAVVLYRRWTSCLDLLKVYPSTPCTF